jgi:hypothetical protein
MSGSALAAWACSDATVGNTRALVRWLNCSSATDNPTRLKKCLKSKSVAQIQRAVLAVVKQILAKFHVEEVKIKFFVCKFYYSLIKGIGLKCYINININYIVLYFIL